LDLFHRLRLLRPSVPWVRSVRSVPWDLWVPSVRDILLDRDNPAGRGIRAVPEDTDSISAQEGRNSLALPDGFA
jgi:hypothetical protein